MISTNHRITTLVMFIVWLFLPLAAATTVNPLFSPTDKPTKKLIELINNAKTSIHAAVYMLTDKTIAQALIDAHNNHHVEVSIILDQASLGEYGKVDLLTANNIPVFVFNPQAAIRGDTKWPSDPIMHNKFAIIDGITVWTGSFNWTVSANRLNCENVVYFNDAGVAKAFDTSFSQILKQCTPASKYQEAKEAAMSLREKVALALQTSPNDTVLLEKLAMLLHQHALME